MCLSPNFNYYRHCASHELFHIMYQELVWEKLGMKRIIWFDEGMAELFSGEYNFTKEIYDKLGFEKFRKIMYNEDEIIKYG